MTTLYVFEKSTDRVVAIINGPDGGSCEHMAGHIDETGAQPYCKDTLGWSYTLTAMLPADHLEATAKGIRATGPNEPHELIVLDGCPVIEAHPLDTCAPIGAPGGPRKMSKLEFERHVRELAAMHGVEV